MSMEPMEHVNPLTYATTQNLLEELTSRFDHAVFLGRSVRLEGFDGKGDPKPVETERWRWKGDARVCQALGQTLSIRICMGYDQGLSGMDPEDV